MEIVSLLIVSTVLGSTPFAEASSCFNCFKSDETPLPKISGITFRPVEVTQNYRQDVYPNCRSVKEFKFGKGIRESKVVRVKLLKTAGQNTNVVDDPQYEMTIMFRRTKNNQFSLNKKKFPKKPEDIGLDPIENYTDPNSARYNEETANEIRRLYDGVRISLESSFVFDIHHVAPDKSYAIFETSNKECAWIGWNETWTGTREMTPEIQAEFQKCDIRTHQFRRDRRELPPPPPIELTPSPLDLDAISEGQTPSGSSNSGEIVQADR